MRGELENDLKLNLCQYKLKRAKRMALGKLEDVVGKVLPKAQHRYCVRHIESNWCKRWRSGQMRKLMWWCSWSSYDEEFKDQLTKLGKLSKDGARD
ncbi:hypothetical protein H5410_014830 [Solanum commersonii]|uniref:Uncharacterized protein n=1 Tax=Solanum commersonii TaxID=4109 RepID=A0A9J5ZS15_SOLCO|nr:hypothetical protein H5410_014830 [Solanum commersonii]